MKRFKDLSDNFIESNKTYDFFVNWDLVDKKMFSIKVKLNILNSLLGTDNFKAELYLLLSNYPDLLSVFPILLAIRDKEITVCELDEEIHQKKYIFSNYEEHNFEHIYTFIEKTGLINLFVEKKVSNLVDYVFGVEVGLDTNGRKNRSGIIMEEIVEQFLISKVNDIGFEYIREATSTKIMEKFGIEVKVDKQSRRFDFVIKKNDTLYMIEVNFYSSGGSKLKATAGEYKGLNDTLKEQGFVLIWITDGQGWNTSLRPLEEAFNNNEYIINLSDMASGDLESILNNEV